jgi:beta-galactosidase
MQSSFLTDSIVIGVSYYPEHWPKERWPEDIRLMKEAGIQAVRIVELAWSFLEPEDGRFEFGWVDDFIRLADENGIRVRPFL